MSGLVMARVYCNYILDRGTRSKAYKTTTPPPPSSVEAKAMKEAHPLFHILYLR